ncbi:MAG: methylmalonyl-CoA mutase, partial [Deltaproteobacteria bacterium]|nr:methylmalonyl-CoA mutase [Deltaproteobacteria bacterium]
DEALGLGHSLEAQQLCEDAARIILEECKLGDVLDPLAGSYYIEHLTAKYTQEIWDFIEKVDEMGGAAAAVENGWIKNECVRQAYEYLQATERGEEVQVGVNKYNGPEEMNVTTTRTLPYDHLKRMDSEERQLAKLKKIKAERNNDNVRDCLKIIKENAQDEKVNLIPNFIDAVKEYTSLGEICNTLREVFGEAQI